MGVFYRLALLVLFFSFTVLSVNGQSPKPVVYTQSGCGNCAFVKQKFQEKNISFVERKLETDSNAVAMVELLREKGYDGRIILPVMVFQDTIFHPVIKNGEVFVPVSPGAAIDSLSEAYFSAAKFVKQNKTNNEGEKNALILDTYYVVCSNFKDSEEAVAFVKELKNKGFSDSGYLFYEEFYRVYSHTCLSRSDALESREKVRSFCSNAYILKTSN